MRYPRLIRYTRLERKFKELYASIKEKINGKTN